MGIPFDPKAMVRVARAGSDAASFRALTRFVQLEARTLAAMGRTRDVRWSLDILSHVHAPYFKAVLREVAVRKMKRDEVTTVVVPEYPHVATRLAYLNEGVDGAAYVVETHGTLQGLPSPFYWVAKRSPCLYPKSDSPRFDKEVVALAATTAWSLAGIPHFPVYFARFTSRENCTQAVELAMSDLRAALRVAALGPRSDEVVTNLAAQSLIGIWVAHVYLLGIFHGRAIHCDTHTGNFLVFATGNTRENNIWWEYILEDSAERIKKSTPSERRTPRKFYVRDLGNYVVINDFSRTNQGWACYPHPMYDYYRVLAPENAGISALGHGIGGIPAIRRALDVARRLSGVREVSGESVWHLRYKPTVGTDDESDMIVPLLEALGVPQEAPRGGTITRTFKLVTDRVAAEDMLPPKDVPGNLLPTPVRETGGRWAGTRHARRVRSGRA